MKTEKSFLETPDGRYTVVRGRLWRKTNPQLPEDEKKRLVADLVSARRAVKESAGGEGRLREAGRLSTPRSSVWASGDRFGGRMARGPEPPHGKATSLCGLVFQAC